MSCDQMNNSLVNNADLLSIFSKIIELEFKTLMH
jgi:hypothetical protein